MNAPSIVETDARAMLLVMEKGLNQGSVSTELLRLEAGLRIAHWSNDLAFAKAWRRMALAQMGTRQTLDSEVFAKKASIFAVCKLIPLVFRSAAMELSGSQQLELLEVADMCEQCGSYESALEAANRAEKYTRVYSIDLAEYVARECVNALAAVSKQNCGQIGVFGESVAKAIVYGADSIFAATQNIDKKTQSIDKRLKKALDASDQFLAESIEGVVQILIEMKSPGSGFLYLAERTAD